MFSSIKKNKKILFGLLGFISGSSGALLAEIVSQHQYTYFYLILFTGLWAALAAMVISVGLFWANRIYDHKENAWRELFRRAIPSGLIAGAASGGIAQAVFGLTRFPDSVVQLVFLAGCWGILGGILGFSLSHAIPNMGTRNALVGGAVGGFTGGAGFQLLGMMIPETSGRMIGVGILGSALGLCIVLAEERHRSAFLEVHWAPDEVSVFTLGNIPLFIGGGDEDDIHVNGLPHRVMSLVVEKGIVKGARYDAPEKKELHDGSHIKLGSVEMIVRIAQVHRSPRRSL
jgi:hypothetical protein